MKDKFAEWQELVAPAVNTFGQNLQVKVFSNRRLTGEAAAFDFIDTSSGVAEREGYPECGFRFRRVTGRIS